MVRTGYNSPWKKKTAVTAKKKTAITRRQRRILDNYQVFMKSPYHSIILLTMLCAWTKGLKFEHYRWALVKDYGGLANSQSPTKYEMVNFFKNHDVYEGYKKFCFSGNTFSEDEIKKSIENTKSGNDRFYHDLNYIQEKYGLERGCITTNSNLHNYIEKLVTRYKILGIKEGEYGKKRYYLREKVLYDMNRFLLIRLIHECPDFYLERLLEQVKLFLKEIKDVPKQINSSLSTFS